METMIVSHDADTDMLFSGQEASALTPDAEVYGPGLPFAELPVDVQNHILAVTLEESGHSVTEGAIRSLRLEYKNIMGFDLGVDALDKAADELVQFMAYQRAHFYDDDDMDD